MKKVSKTSSDMVMSMNSSMCEQIIEKEFGDQMGQKQRSLKLPLEEIISEHEQRSGSNVNQSNPSLFAGDKVNKQKKISGQKLGSFFNNNIQTRIEEERKGEDIDEDDMDIGATDEGSESLDTKINNYDRTKHLSVLAKN